MAGRFRQPPRLARDILERARELHSGARTLSPVARAIASELFRRAATRKRRRDQVREIIARAGGTPGDLTAHR